MITLKDKETNCWLGQISYEQLKFLNSELEEDHKNNQDYWINRVALDALKERGADALLISIIEKALGDKYSIEFYWMKS
jgi:hypothetical protein